jgi:hypothetical protein
MNGGGKRKMRLFISKIVVTEKFGCKYAEGNTVI